MMAEPGESSTKGSQTFKIARQTKTYKCADYNVAWICALRDTELLAARVLLDEEYATPSYSTQYDRNTYICGIIGEHRVVIACMPSGRSGNVNADHLTGPMFHTFPNLKITLLVGIGGGVPLKSPRDPQDDIYLGDVVVGWPGDGTPAVIQYDYGRWKVDGVFEQRGSVDQPDWHLTQALDIVVSNHEVGQTKFEDHIFRLQELPKFSSRKSEEDRLFQAAYTHQGDYFSECAQCLPEQLVDRPKHANARPGISFKFHFGVIASGGAVIQDGELRDRLSKECNDARCFEMEAVGVNLNSRCLVVRGIADYADSHKNDAWKYTAAGNAAAFAKELLLTMKASGLQEISRIIPGRRPISTIPGTLSINPDFVGRDDIFQEMDYLLQETNRVGLVGLGGIGKTEIAVNYCHKYQRMNLDCHIFWVYGATPQSFDDGYRKIARELEIPGWDDPLFEHRIMVPRELDKSETCPWVMILDNADDYSIYFPPQGKALSEKEQKDYLAYSLPSGNDNGGRIIITTRNKKVGEAIMGNFRHSPILIGELTSPNAKELLRRKLPREKWEGELAEMLVRELEYIPLAITQAAAFIKQYAIATLKFYLGKLNQFHLNVQDVLSKDLLDSRRHPGSANAVFRTWEISYMQIDSENAKATQKLALMAVLDNQAVPQMLLCEGEKPEVDEMDAIQVLLDFSLIKGDEEYQFFSMHPLQQLSAQNWLRLYDNLLEEWQDYALVHLDNRMPTVNDEEHRKICSMLLPHAVLVTSYNSEEKLCKAFLLRKISHHEQELGRYQYAYQHAVESYEILLEVNGEMHVDTLEIKYQVGILLIDLGKYSYAKPILTQVFQRQKSLLGNEHVHTLQSARELGTVSRKLREYEEALKNFQFALEGYKRLSIKEEIMLCVNCLVDVFKDMGEVEKAEKVHQEVLEETIALSGESEPAILAHKQSPADVSREQSDDMGAVQLRRLDIRRQEEEYGTEHPKTIAAYSELAFVLDNQGDFVAAERLYRKVFDYRERMLGLDHPDTLKAMCWIAGVLKDLGKLDQEKEMQNRLEKVYRRALEERQHALGHKHPDTRYALEDLAAYLWDQERWQESEPYMRECAEIWEQINGKDSLDALNHRDRLALNLARQQKNEEALHIMQDVLERLKRCHASENKIFIQRLEWGHERMLKRVSLRQKTSHTEDTENKHSTLTQALAQGRNSMRLANNVELMDQHDSKTSTANQHPKSRRQHFGFMDIFQRKNKKIWESGTPSVKANRIYRNPLVMESNITTSKTNDTKSYKPQFSQTTTGSTDMESHLEST